MTGIVSAWSDDSFVYLVEADSDSPEPGRVKCRRVPAMYSAFIKGADAADRHALSRDTTVTAVIEDGAYTRVNFKTHWDRRRICDRVSERVNSDSLIAAMQGKFSADAKVLEADVGPIRRLFSDNGHLQIGTPRIGYFDLETDSRQSFANAIDGKARVLSWAMEGLGFRAEDCLREDTDTDERRVLAAFFDAADRFDCLVAWNGDGFDFPVLKNRAPRIKAKRGNGRPVVFERWCWLDQLLVFKKYNQAHESGEERSSFKLDAVAQNLLGEGKHDFDASKTWEAWAAGGVSRETMQRYNVQDTALLPRIEEKTGFLAMHIAVCQVTRCFPDSVSLGAAMQGDGFLLRLGAERGYRFPSKKFWKEGEAPEQFEGAYVMEPKRLGVIDNVHVCDFAGLYPSIMRSWNMSEETACGATDLPGVPRCKLPDRNVWFRTDTRGIYAVALDTLVAKRAEYTKRADAAPPGSEEWDRFKRLSSAYKIIANSFYGIVGSPYARFFNPAIAEGVTQTGAWLIKHVMKVSEAADMTPIYGDTDSAFVQGDEDTFQRITDTLNGDWARILGEMGCTESRIKLEFEKSFKRLILVSKKRYAGKYYKYKGRLAPDTMKAEVKGLEYKRGDSLRLAREMQKELIDTLLPDAAVMPELPSAETAKDFVAKWRDRILKGELELRDVVVSQSVKNLKEYKDKFTAMKCTGTIGKAKCGHTWDDADASKAKTMPVCPRCGTARKTRSQPAHVRVAKLLKERGEDVTEGTRIEYVIVVNPDMDTLCAMPAGDPGVFERIDRNHYWDQKVFPPTARLLELIYPGVVWEESVVKRDKAEAVKSGKGRVNDLPLFGAEPVAAEPVKKRRRITPVATPPTPGHPLHIAMTEGGDTEALRALKAALEAHPGAHLVTLFFGDKPLNTGISVTKTKECRAAIERVLGNGEKIVAW